MGKTILLRLLDIYQWALSPLLPRSCRFYPTCSAYAREAIMVHGAGRGSLLTFKRLLKCHPFHPGGVDLVPPYHPTEQKDGP
ncbi:MAG: membrane protein insertion efficiency factor YidD [Pseudomonadota bacterium]|nr:membrane protein insertion efficiency factor YidD [Pseudomonadota bacterium]MED5443557.1 membrane protein insertion efficiency factor YidD [Pseudomonadota bacterium]